MFIKQVPIIAIHGNFSNNGSLSQIFFESKLMKGVITDFRSPTRPYVMKMFRK